MTLERISVHDAAREMIAAANADPNFVMWSKRAFMAVQALEEALKLRAVWGADHVEPIDGTMPPPDTSTCPVCGQAHYVPQEAAHH